MSTSHNIATNGRVRWLYPLSLATAVAMLVAWFPIGTLLHQQGQLSATSREIAVVQGEERALQLRQRTASSKAQAALLARQLYQLVSPGQSLIQVLPGTSASSGPGSGDPGYQPLVAPSSALSTTPTTPRATRSSTSGWRGFVGRLERTLEFWR